MPDPPPIVSVIIPTYNSRRWIGDTIDSVLAQTYPHYEIIVIDDGSTDGTGDWLQRQYGDKVRYVWQSNQGRARARNVGLKLARGKYIQNLDADDTLLPHKFERQVAFLEENPQYAVVYGHTLLFYDDEPECTRDAPWQHLYRSGQILKYMVQEGFIYTGAALYVRSWLERVGGFDESLPTTEDWDINLRLALAGAQFYYLDGAPVVLYRKYRSRGPEFFVNESRTYVRVLEKLANSLTPDQRKALQVRQSLGNWHFVHGRWLVRTGQRSAGIKEMLRGLAQDQRQMP